jgi:hypothetical protein
MLDVRSCITEQHFDVDLAKNAKIVDLVKNTKIAFFLKTLKIVEKLLCRSLIITNNNFHFIIFISARGHFLYAIF